MSCVIAKEAETRTAGPRDDVFEMPALAGALFVPAVALLYAAVALVMILHHEPWRDEADAWLAARDLGLPALFQWTRHVGHPSLWFLILMPFAKSGCPYFTLHLVHLAISLTAVVVFLKFAPFPRWVTAGAVFSYPILCEYTVIARNYSLCVLLLWGIAALYPRRFERPALYTALILLLFSAIPHSFATAGLLLALFAWEVVREQHWDSRMAGPLALGVFGGLLALVQLWPPADGQLQNQSLNWCAPLRALGNAAVPFCDDALLDLIGIPSLALGISMLLVVTLALLRTPRVLLLLYGSSAWLCFIYAFKWYGGRRHAGLLFVLVLFVLWIAHHERQHRTGASWLTADRCRHWLRSAAALAIACLGSGWIASIQFCSAEIHSRFSNAEAMGRFIREAGYNDYVVAAHCATRGSAVLPYLRQKKLWYPAIERYGSHMPWNREFERGERISNWTAACRVEEQFRDCEKVLLLLNRPLLEADRLGFELIHQTGDLDTSPYGEAYWLYRKRPAGHASAVRPSPSESGCER